MPRKSSRARAAEFAARTHHHLAQERALQQQVDSLQAEKRLLSDEVANLKQELQRAAVAASQDLNRTQLRCSDEVKRVQKDADQRVRHAEGVAQRVEMEQKLFFQLDLNAEVEKQTKKLKAEKAAAVAESKTLKKQLDACILSRDTATAELANARKQARAATSAQRAASKRASKAEHVAVEAERRKDLALLSAEQKVAAVSSARTAQVATERDKRTALEQELAEQRKLSKLAVVRTLKTITKLSTDNQFRYAQRLLLEFLELHYTTESVPAIIEYVHARFAYTQSARRQLGGSKASMHRHAATLRQFLSQTFGEDALLAVQHYLRSLDDDELDVVVPVGFVQRLLREFVVRLQKYWSGYRALRMIGVMCATRESYDSLQKLMRMTYDPAAALWRPDTIMGVLLPRLPTWYSILAIRLLIKAQLGFSNFTIGGMDVARIDVMTALQMSLVKFIPLIVKAIKAGARARLVAGTDGAGFLRQTTVSTFTVRIAGVEGISCHSPLNSPPVCTWEGSDHVADVRLCAGRTIEQLRKVNDVGKLYVRDPATGEVHTLDLLPTVGCGDASFTLSCFGLGGVGARYCCDKCHATRDVFNSVDLDMLNRIETRTLASIRNLAHLVPNSVCKGCGKHVVEPATPADPVPKGHLIKHFGVRLGVGTLFWWEPLLQIICVLHTVLNITKDLFADTFLPIMWDDKQQKDVRSSVGGDGDSAITKVEAVVSWGKRNGIQFKTLTPHSKQVGEQGKVVKEHRFVGNECLVLVNRFESLLDITHPESVSATMKKQNALVRDLWLAWRTLVAALTFAYEPGEPQQWDVLAHSTQLAAVAFVSKWAEYAPNRKTLHQHYCVQHVPQQIREVGPLIDFSGTPLESLHKELKMLMRYRSSLMQAGRGRSKRKDGSFTVHSVGRVAQTLAAAVVDRAAAVVVPVPRDFGSGQRRKRLLNELKEVSEPATGAPASSSASSTTASPPRKRATEPITDNAALTVAALRTLGAVAYRGVNSPTKGGEYCTSDIKLTPPP